MSSELSSPEYSSVSSILNLILSLLTGIYLPFLQAILISILGLVPLLLPAEVVRFDDVVVRFVGWIGLWEVEDDEVEA